MTAAVNHKMRTSSDPRIAIQAAAGAMPRQKPSTKCDSDVKRLQNEYKNKIASASGESAKHRPPSSPAAATKIRQAIAVKPQANRTESSPAGKCRIAVRR